MCLSKNKKNSVYPSKPQFYFIKVGLKGGGVKIIQAFVHDGGVCGVLICFSSRLPLVHR